MKKVLFLFCFIPLLVQAQLERVWVETYYVSDSLDATDTLGGYLKPGSVTYRVYVDMARGSVLKSVYADANHALRFASTDTFFNHLNDGQLFGKEFSKNRYGEGTVALDTWLTLGQTTRISTKTNFGTPKQLDDDGTFIGGINNDGGSAVIATGLLTNPNCGIALTTADGMDTMTNIPTGWVAFGVDDSSMFGSLTYNSSFVSNNAAVAFPAGVGGVNTDSNMVLVAQLTTAGELSFEMNVEITDSTGNTIMYVANDSVLLSGEVLSSYLKYPYAAVCGCPDPQYLEYLGSRDCDNLDLCQTFVVFGCMDTAACNFNGNANYHVQSLCCYPGYCNDRDLATVCPQLVNQRLKEMPVTFSPNPVQDILSIQLHTAEAQKITYVVTDISGRVVAQGSSKYGETVCKAYCSQLQKGIYIIQVTGTTTAQTTFVKN